jgi:hypothetical protein
MVKLDNVRLPSGHSKDDVPLSSSIRPQQICAAVVVI